MNHSENTEALILAGGRGTRLRGVVNDRPKVVALVNNKPFIFFILEQLIEADVGRVILCTGYMSDYVRDVVGEKYKTLNIEYSHEETPLGTAGALRNAKSMLRGKAVLVINGDSFVEIDFKDFSVWHEMKKADVSIAITLSDKMDRYGTVEMSLDQRVIQFSEKSNRNANGPIYISVGAYMINKFIIDGIFNACL